MVRASMPLCGHRPATSWSQATWWPWPILSAACATVLRTSRGFPYIFNENFSAVQDMYNYCTVHMSKIAVYSKTSFTLNLFRFSHMFRADWSFQTMFSNIEPPPLCRPCFSVHVSQYIPICFHEITIGLGFQIQLEGFIGSPWSV